MKLGIAIAARMIRISRTIRIPSNEIPADLESLIKQILVQRLMANLPGGEWDELVEDVVNRKLDPQMAAEKLWGSVS